MDPETVLRLLTNVRSRDNCMTSETVTVGPQGWDHSF